MSWWDEDLTSIFGGGIFSRTSAAGGSRTVSSSAITGGESRNGVPVVFYLFLELLYVVVFTGHSGVS